jgi:hypothetical protein
MTMDFKNLLLRNQIRPLSRMPAKKENLTLNQKLRAMNATLTLIFQNLMQRKGQKLRVGFIKSNG